MSLEADRFRHPLTLAASLAEMMSLALSIRDEVAGEAEEGRVALAWAARNRMERFGPPNVEEQSDIANPGFVDKAFCRAFAAACLVAAGDIADPTGGATHFHRHDDEPRWARAATPKALIGRHIFYALRPEVGFLAAADRTASVPCRPAR